MTEGPGGNPVVTEAVAQWQAELTQLRAENQATLLELARSGVQPDPMRALSDQITTLMESVAEAMGPQGDQFRLLAQVRWQQRVKAGLADLATEVRKATLAAGGRVSMRDVDRMARQSGLVPGHKGQLR